VGARVPPKGCRGSGLLLALVLVAPGACEDGSRSWSGGNDVDSSPPLQSLRARDLTFRGDTLWVLADGDSAQALFQYLLSVPEAPIGSMVLPDSLAARRVAVTEREVFLQTDRSEVLAVPREAGPARRITLPSPDAPFAVGSLGQLWAPRWEYVGFFLQASEPGPIERPFARRPLDRAESLNRAAGPRARLRLIAVSSGDTIHVFDNRTGVLHKYDTLGARVSGWQMPVELAEVVQLATRPRLGMSREPLATELEAGCDGELSLRLAGGPVEAVRVDPVTYEWRVLDAGELKSTTSLWICRGWTVLLDREWGRVRIQRPREA
jgi:hypothetical protein